MLVLGIDFETTGLEYANDRIIEAGAVLWDTERGTPVRMYSQMCWDFEHSEPDLSDEIIKLTGITPMMLATHAMKTNKVLDDISELIDFADYMCAHNAEFDESFLIEEGDKFDFNFRGIKKWIDTRTDLPLEAYTKGKSSSLGYLASDHGFINPFPHRAVTDVLTMMKLFSMYDLETIIERSESPAIDVVAKVSFDEKDKAKSAGFHWDGQRKVWHRMIKEVDFDDLSQNWDFEVKK